MRVCTDVPTMRRRQNPPSCAKPEPALTKQWEDWDALSLPGAVPKPGLPKGLSTAWGWGWFQKAPHSPWGDEMRL